MMSARRRAELLACRAVPRPGEIHRVSPLVIEYLDPGHSSSVHIMPPVTLYAGFAMGMLQYATHDMPHACRVIYPVPHGTPWKFMLFRKVPWYRNDENASPQFIPVQGPIAVLVTATDCMRASNDVIVCCLLPSGIVGWAVWASVFTTWRRIV